MYRCPMDATFGFPPRINIIESKSLNQNFDLKQFEFFRRVVGPRGAVLVTNPLSPLHNQQTINPILIMMNNDQCKCKYLSARLHLYFFVFCILYFVFGKSEIMTHHPPQTLLEDATASKTSLGITHQHSSTGVTTRRSENCNPLPQ